MTLRLGAVLVSGALVALTACGTDDNSGLSGAVDFSLEDLDCGPGGTLLASGSSAQSNAMEVWVNTYQANCDGSQINYKATGSGAGVQEFLQGTTAFAGTDSRLTEGEVDESRSVCRDGGQAVHLPMLAGPIAVGYHVPGVDDLVLDSATLARIFDSEIRRWNDPAIAELNPDAELPDIPITPFHRSDGSGTTDNFTSYLHTAAPDAWPYEPDKAWKGSGGQSAEGSSGLVGMVQQNEGAISYFELSYAHQNGIDTVRVDTGADEPVEATVENASNAIAEADLVGTGGDLALELDSATRERGVYPIVLVTYEIVCDRGNAPGTLDLTRAFLGYAAGEEGQRALAEIDYAPISDDIIQQVRRRIDALA
ncbi:phosphate ABC transporter substrate-binding protein PstS [Streptomyces sp. NBC_01803]|uniref:phosphate ABC transporter substrate-binding protein PstS n=1 Tax=Streptomyces sp. NBC_01803 TaxID=2975946 RepID=UPI002DD8A03E|nr:phosphate ABC transporter substrate-binding protein PstS [Streptomyces sp. NBC_01803]WSA44887.1 phosphate ABC transporter substrate-binding protein PstS [Streptomyces sp. NBC_01803]